MTGRCGCSTRRIIFLLCTAVFFIGFPPSNLGAQPTDAAAVSREAEADDAFEKRNYPTAWELYLNVRERTPFAERPDSWKRLTVNIVRCSTAMGDAENAAEEFFLLCRIDPSTSLDAIPLPWFVPLDSNAGTRPREKTAEDVLDPLQTKSRGPAATLLAAAILSTSPTTSKRSRGSQLLRDLFSLSETGTAENPKTAENELRLQAAQLAGILLWKQRIPTLRRPEDLLPLERRLKQVPEPLRAGPEFLYASAANRVGEFETAVLHWMRLPILYPENRLLAVESLREAAKTLEKLGRREQAESLRLEAERYQ